MLKKQIGSFVTGAIAAGSLPASIGIMDWRIIAGAAVLGGVGALCGVNVAALIKGRKGRRGPSRPPSE